MKNLCLIMKPSYFYIEALDSLMARDKYFESKPLDDLLILCIYKYEPDTRKSIDVIKTIQSEDLRKLNIF